MQTPKMQITPKKYNEETTVISMRMPKDMLREIDSVAEKTGRTRNEILTRYFILDILTAFIRQGNLKRLTYKVRGRQYKVNGAGFVFSNRKVVKGDVMYIR